MGNVLSIILYVMNMSLFVHTSIDENFDTIDKSNINTDKSIRISLLYIPLGHKIIYFITYNKKFNFMKLLSFDDVQIKISPVEIENMVRKYKEETIRNHSDKKISQQEEFLKIQLSENQASMSTISNKINYHTTITLAFAAVLTFTYSKIQTIDNSFFYFWIVFYLALINVFDILSLILFLYKSVQVRGVYKSSLKDLIDTDEKTALVSTLYRDWKSSSSERTYQAGVTKNSEKLLLRIMMVGMLILSLSIILTPVPISVSQETIPVRTNHTSYQLIFYKGI